MILIISRSLIFYVHDVMYCILRAFHWDANHFAGEEGKGGEGGSSSNFSDRYGIYLENSGSTRHATPSRRKHAQLSPVSHHYRLETPGTVPAPRPQITWFQVHENVSVMYMRKKLSCTLPCCRKRCRTMYLLVYCRISIPLVRSRRCVCDTWQVPPARRRG